MQPCLLDTHKVPLAEQSWTLEFGARIIPHSPLPKGKKSVLGNISYKALPTERRSQESHRQLSVWASLLEGKPCVTQVLES